MRIAGPMRTSGTGQGHMGMSGVGGAASTTQVNQVNQCGNMGGSPLAPAGSATAGSAGAPLGGPAGDAQTGATAPLGGAPAGVAQLGGLEGLIAQIQALLQQLTALLTQKVGPPILPPVGPEDLPKVGDDKGLLPPVDQNDIPLPPDAGQLPVDEPKDETVQPDEPVVQADETPEVEPKPDQEPVQYTVKSGDTLSEIGQKFGVDWHQIYQDNIDVVGSNPNLIKPGQVLQITQGGNMGGGPTGTDTPVDEPDGTPVVVQVDEVVEPKPELPKLTLDEVVRKITDPNTQGAQFITFWTMGGATRLGGTAAQIPQLKPVIGEPLYNQGDTVEKTYTGPVNVEGELHNVTFTVTFTFRSGLGNFTSELTGVNDRGLYVAPAPRRFGGFQAI